MSDYLYEPNSPNAMFSRILERMDQQDEAYRVHREDIKASISKFQADIHSTQHRVQSLEKAAWKQRGFVAAIALVVPAVWQWINSKN